MRSVSHPFFEDSKNVYSMWYSIVHGVVDVGFCEMRMYRVHEKLNLY
jgi:hypothetical protein